MSDETTRRPRTRRPRPDRGEREEDRQRRSRRPRSGRGEDVPKKKRRPTDKDVRTGAAKLDGYLDVHIRCGLEDSIVRIKQADYGANVTLGWMLRRHDIVFRTRLENSEVVIVLRGTDNARLRITKSSPRNSIPLYTVTLANDLREQLIRDIEKGDG